MSTAEPTGALLTRLLRQWSAGDEAVLETLTPLIYEELHRIASAKMARERQDHLLQPSALVNEAFVRLARGAPVDWEDRSHFFAHSARIMRNILVDLARKKSFVRTDFSGLDLPGSDELARVEFLDLDAALTELSELNARHAQIIELRYYGGLSISEVAAAMRISEATVNREWQTARAWLLWRLRPKRTQ